MARLVHLLQKVLCSVAIATMVFVSFIGMVAPVDAAVTPTISYQARLADTSGNPLSDGTYSVKFSIYDSLSSGATPIWTAAGSTASPSAISVTVTSSLLSVQLGDTGAGQNSLSTVDWDQSALYLGITIGSDSEMSPRRRITSVPQALQADNAGRLQGMYASSTASSGSSLFTIHQTQNTGAAATRTALEVRSAGTSSAFDYLFRGVNDVGATVFSINRAGSVTTTGALAVQAPNTSSTILGNVLLGTSTRDTVFPSIFSMDGDDVLVAGQLGVATSVHALGGVYVGNATYYGETGIARSTGTYSISTLSHLTLSAQMGTSMIYMANDRMDLTSPGNIRFTVGASGAIVPATDLMQFGTSDARFNGYFGTVTTTNIVAATVSSSNIVATNTTSTNIFATTVSSSSIVAGYVTTTGPVYVGGSGASSTVLGNVLLGTSTRDTVFPSTFSMDGDDVLVGGQLGVASSVVSTVGYYAVNAAAGHSTFYGATGVESASDSSGFMVSSTLSLSLRSGQNVVIAPGSAGSITPGADLTQFGTSLLRFNGYFANVTSTNIASELVSSTNMVAVNATTTNLIATDISATNATVGTANLTQLTVGESAQFSLSVGMSGLTVAGPSRFDGQSATGAVVSVVNYGLANQNTSWGVFTNRLLVGDNASATGTNSYVSLFGYSTSSNRFGVCLDNVNTASTCLEFSSTSTVYSLLADDAIGANAFDLAERYQISGEAEPGDVLVIDPETPFHMKKSTGVPYDASLSGVVSTRPGFLLGTGGDASVALVGRVPVKVTVANGAIQPGDPLTSSEVPGVAMKATKAGRIIGRALESASVDGMIEVYLQPGFDASALLRADGSVTTISQDIGVRSAGTASAESPTFNSQVLSFLGSAWDGAAAVASEFRLFNHVASVSSSAFTVGYGSSTLFSLDQAGSVEIAGDLALAGRLFPSARGQAQRESYIFVDDTAEEARYISTNADGWQSQDGYDYAERYVSPDELEAGDIVTVKRGSRLYVQRSLRSEDMVVGIVSTKPGFIAGRVQEDAYPIALAGRVPTKVSTINGAIEAGDTLAPSTIPGVAVKATGPGPSIGLALEGYSGSDVGKIEVFVNPGWWGGAPSLPSSEHGQVASAVSRSGFAQIVVGQSRVRVHLDGFIHYPLLQVTPYTQIESGWWIDRVSPEGFDIVLGAPIGRAARFAWTADEVDESPTILLSSGSRFSMDPVSGEIQFPPSQDETTAPAVTPAVESAPEPAVSTDTSVVSTEEPPSSAVTETEEQTNSVSEANAAPASAASESVVEEESDQGPVPEVSAPIVEEEVTPNP